MYLPLSQKCILTAGLFALEPKIVHTLHLVNKSLKSLILKVPSHPVILWLKKSSHLPCKTAHVLAFNGVSLNMFLYPLYFLKGGS